MNTITKTQSRTGLCQVLAVLACFTSVINVGLAQEFPISPIPPTATTVAPADILPAPGQAPPSTVSPETPTNPSVDPQPGPAPGDTLPPLARDPSAAMMGMGGMGMGGMGGMGMANSPITGYSATWYPSRPMKDGYPGSTAPSFGLVRQSVNASVPVWTDGVNNLAFTTNVKNAHFDTNAILPDSGRPFPSDLWSVNFGLNYLRKLENGWTVGGMFGFGSSSDQPFHSIHEMNLSFMGYMMIPACDNRDFWRVGLMYSPVGTLNFPIPMLSYQWNPYERLSIGIGIPFSLTWRPVDDVTLMLMYMPLTTINARLSWRVRPNVTLYTAFEWLNESYFLADRTATADRFIGLEKRLVAGATYRATDRLMIDGSAGYAFDRTYGEGANQGSPTTDTIHIQPGAFISGSVRWRF